MIGARGKSWLDELVGLRLLPFFLFLRCRPIVYESSDVDGGLELGSGDVWLSSIDLGMSWEA